MIAIDNVKQTQFDRERKGILKVFIKSYNFVIIIIKEQRKVDALYRDAIEKYKKAAMRNKTLRREVAGSHKLKEIKLKTKKIKEVNKQLKDKLSKWKPELLKRKEKLIAMKKQYRK